MGAEGLVEGMTGAFQTTTTDNICLVINSDVSGDGKRPALSPSYVSGLTDLLQAFRLEPDKAPCAVILSCLLYTSPSPRDMRRSRMPSSA